LLFATLGKFRANVRNAGQANVLWIFTIKYIQEIEMRKVILLGLFSIFVLFNVSSQQIISPTEFVYVPEGNFKFNDSGNFAHVSSFYISKYEVTEQLYYKVIGKNPSKSSFGNLRDPKSPDWLKKRVAELDSQGIFLTDSSNCPVENVNWYEAIVFCNLLSIKEGLQPVYSLDGETNPSKWGVIPQGHPTTRWGARPLDENDMKWNSIKMNIKNNGYRLPTEMEWLWAAMGATDNINLKYAGNDNPYEPLKYAHYMFGDYSKGDNPPFPYKMPVGLKLPNALGIYDMSGNVNEWCWDWYDDLPNFDISDYTGPLVGKKEIAWLIDENGNKVDVWGGPVAYKVRKGGSQFDPDWALFLNLRGGWYQPFNKDYDTGFRLVRTKM